MIAWHRHGKMAKGIILLICTGWGKKWPNRNALYGTRNFPEETELHFPGMSASAAKWLIKHRSIKAVGTDGPSVDSGPNQRQLPVHQLLSTANILIIEFVANLYQMPAVGSTGQYGSIAIICHHACLSVCLSVILSIYPSVYLSVCPSTCAFVCPHIYLIVCLHICLLVGGTKCYWSSHWSGLFVCFLSFSYWFTDEDWRRKRGSPTIDSIELEERSRVEGRGGGGGQRVVRCRWRDQSKKDCIPRHICFISISIVR